MRGDGSQMFCGALHKLCLLTEGHQPQHKAATAEKQGGRTKNVLSASLLLSAREASPR